MKLLTVVQYPSRMPLTQEMLCFVDAFPSADLSRKVTSQTALSGFQSFGQLQIITYYFFPAGIEEW